MCVTTRAMSLIRDSQRIYLAQAFSFNRLTPAGFLALPLHQSRPFFVFYGRSDNRSLAVSFVFVHCSLAVSVTGTLDMLGLIRSRASPESFRWCNTGWRWVGGKSKILFLFFFFNVKVAQIKTHSWWGSLNGCGLLFLTAEWQETRFCATARTWDTRKHVVK